MSSLPPPPLLHSDTTALHPAVYAEVVDELSLTVRQLLLAALSRARQLPSMPAQAALPSDPPSVPVSVRGLAPVPLSSREHEVLQRIAAGDSNKMIARALGLSLHTVKRHVANILNKLDLRSRGQAAAWWTAQRPQHRLDH
jgi:LuxR family maltose regulon positive regulatory protein